MRLLLDTHAWVWQVGASAHLSSRARTALTDAGNELYLSPISVWEVGMLAAGGRLTLHPNTRTWVASALAASPTQPAELTHDVALETATLPASVGKDPADRFLVASCRVHGLTLVTADRQLRASPAVRTLW